MLDPKKGGYDAKADIWSFGITAIELATGSAPYAKFAPLKVLMMTIANEPPTLDTSNCKWRFSRSFRDLIALCLQKDPTKRPTAAALLKHSFFRQAKKKEYLVKSLMKDLPAIGERQSSKRVPAATAEVKMEQRGMSWDFSSSTSLSDQDDSRSVSIVSSSSSSSSHSPSSDLAEAHGRIRSEGAAANAAASARRASDSRFVRGHARSHSTPIIAPVSSTGSSPAGTVQRGRFQVAAAIPEDATVSPPSPAVGAASIGASSPSTSKRRGRFTVTNVDAMHSSSDVDSDVNVAVASSKVVPSRGVSFASVRSSSISSTSSSSGGGMNSPGSTVASGATLSNALASAINTPLATDGPGVDALLEQAAQIRVTVPTALGQHSQSEEVVSLQERMLETIAQLERALRTTATRR